jgi:hypothetical protein
MTGVHVVVDMEFFTATLDTIFIGIIPTIAAGVGMIW